MTVWRQPEAPFICIRPIPLSCTLRNSAFGLRVRVISRHTYRDTEYKNWLEEFKDVNDKRVLWDLVKYKIRQRTIIYSKAKARKKRDKVKQLEETLSNCTIHCDNNPSKENLEELECLQAEYDQLYDYITQGAIIRSRATWYELGEKKQ